jgi:PhzF family phenazine biosynthesis protein
MAVPLHQVDAFATGPFTGNPAAVCLLEEPASEEWMQAVASEMNLSETAFLVPTGDGWKLRWFTPAAEVELCGHATLASAHVLFETGALPADGTARFDTLSGLLTADRSGDEIRLDFPAWGQRAMLPPAGLYDALGAVPLHVGLSDGEDWLCVLDSEEAVRELRPDMGLLRKIPGRGLMITARASGDDYDFVSRFFAPAFGVDEDPVTGSAHCCLAPYWADKLGKNEMVGYQASARGGRVGVRCVGDRVELLGAAFTVLVGELRA